MAGRPRSKEVKVAESMAQAAGLLDMPIEVLELAKKRKCPAFRSSKVYLDELLPWLEANKTSVDEAKTRDELELEKLRIECKTRQFKLEVLQGKYTENAAIKKQITELVSELKSALRSKLEVELPPITAGCEIAEVQRKNREAFDEFCNRLNKAIAA